MKRTRKATTQEPTLINTLARKVGHAAGTIAKATQGLTRKPIASSPAEKARGNQARTSRQRSGLRKRKAAQ